MPEDPTIIEGSSPVEEPAKGGSGGVALEGSTIIEGAGGAAEGSTIIEGVQARAEASINLVPVEVNEDELVVALSDPGDIDVTDGLTRMVDYTSIVFKVASEPQIHAAIDRFYGSVDEAVEQLLQQLSQTQVDLDQMQTEGGAAADGAGVEIHRALITNSLLVLILERGLADEQDLEVVQGEHNLSGESVAALLAKGGLVDVPTQLELIAEYLGTDVIDISRIDFTEDLVSLMPLDMAKQYQCVPIGLDGEVIHLSMVDPLNPTVLDELAFQLNHPLQVRVADPNQILHILEEKYSGEATFDD